MKEKKNKIVILFQGLLVLFLVIGSITYTLSVTVMSYSHTVLVLEKNRYYEKLSESLETYYKSVSQVTNIELSALSSLYSNSRIRDYTNSMLKSYYLNEEIVYDNSDLVTTLRTDISEYLAFYNLEYESEVDLESFINSLVSHYDEEITLNNVLNETRSNFATVKIVVSVLLSISLIYIFLFMIFNHFKYKKKIDIYGYPMLISSFFMFFSYYYLVSEIDYKSIVFGNGILSSIIFKIVSNFNDLFLVFGLVYLGFGVFIIVKKNFQIMLKKLV